MKKKFISVLLSAVMAVSMIGCGSSSGAKDSEKKEEAKTVEAKADIPSEIKNKVEIEFWHSMKGGNEESIKQITKDFEDKNPNIKIKLVNQGGYRDLFQKLMGAAKSNTLPAITQIYNNRLTWYMDKELVQDLKPYEKDKKHGMKDEEVKDIAEIFYKDGTFGDKQYSLPLNKSQMVMYYNEDMLKEKGVEVPKTWDELKEASKKLTVDKDKDGKPEVHGIAFENNISTDIGIWVRQAGGEVIDEDKDKINFDSAETKAAVNFISEMIKDKTATLAGEDKHSNNVFIKKRAAMCVASTSALPYIKKSFEGKWFVAPLPVDKVYAQLYYGTNIAMFNKGTPEQKLAAWLYMKHLINTENTTKFSMDTGYIPVRKSAIESEKYKEFLKKNQAKEVPLKTLDKGWTGSRGIGTIPALDVLGKELEQVFAGKKSVDEALKTAQQNGEKAMKEARSN
ncbi:ABC transporter substrate-binding protein [Hathewaya histolytica]|uniref:Carbohydrate uptake ABC transporter substrate-binding protein n=1 Tax=Hathewaya histolytica TaxID=1498 RepID=A0A4U9R0D3_HATHI|nr:ABC transporter substrate-binding protein [Hathewaya histolytica]VTQ82130.1 carbohydrate uptake ABC transporter substrate-binding protein [Hathewaya histolytica]